MDIVAGALAWFANWLWTLLTNFDFYVVIGLLYALSEVIDLRREMHELRSWRRLHADDIDALKARTARLYEEVDKLQPPTRG